MLVLLLASCAPSARRDQAAGPLPDLQSPQIQLATAAPVIQRFDPPGTGARVTVTVPVTISNPNPFPLQIDRIDYSHALGDNSGLRTGEANVANLLLLAHATHQATLELTANLNRDTGLLTRTAQALTGSGLPFMVEGAVIYSSQSHPWQTTDSFSLTGVATARTAVLAPELSLVPEDTSVFFLPDSEGAVVRVVIRIHNPGSVGYLVHAKDLIVELDGQPVAGQDLQPTPVAAGQTAMAALTFMPTTGLLTPQTRELLSNALAGMPTELSLRGRAAWDVLGLDSFQEPAEMRLSAQLNGN